MIRPVLILQAHIQSFLQPLLPWFVLAAFYIFKAVNADYLIKVTLRAGIRRFFNFKTHHAHTDTALRANIFIIALRNFLRLQFVVLFIFYFEEFLDVQVDYLDGIAVNKAAARKMFHHLENINGLKRFIL